MHTIERVPLGFLEMIRIQLTLIKFDTGREVTKIILHEVDANNFRRAQLRKLYGIPVVYSSDVPLGTMRFCIEQSSKAVRMNNSCDVYTSSHILYKEVPFLWAEKY